MSKYRCHIIQQLFVVAEKATIKISKLSKLVLQTKEILYLGVKVNVEKIN